jgi:hypothetical protein
VKRFGATDYILNKKITRGTTRAEGEKEEEEEEEIKARMETSPSKYMVRLSQKRGVPASPHEFSTTLALINTGKLVHEPYV